MIVGFNAVVMSIPDVSNIGRNRVETALNIWYATSETFNFSSLLVLSSAS